MSEVHALVSYTGSPGIEILTGAGEGELTPHVFCWEGGGGGGVGTILHLTKTRVRLQPD